MKKINQVGLSLLVGSGMLLGLSATQTTAHACTYLRYYQDIANQTASVTNRSATVYTSGSLKHRAGTMWNYHAKVEQYYAAHVTKNGKASVYYKFRDGKRTGWVWHGYLKSIASSTGTTPTNGATTPTNTTTIGSKSIAPGTTVDNMDWTKLEQQRYVDVDSDSAYMMQLFSGTIYDQRVQNAAKLSWNTTDGVDFAYDDQEQGWQRELNDEKINSKGFKAIRFTAKAPYDHAAIEQAITKAGYDANARTKFAGWSIGAEYMTAEGADEGPEAGGGLILLVPNP